MAEQIRLSSVTLDCPSAPELAAFYAEITRGTVSYSNPQYAVVNGPAGRIDFQTVPNHRPPTWPSAEVPAQMHLDFLVTDRQAAEARVLAAGATKYAEQPNADHCFVYADPAGHAFCLTTWDDVGAEVES